MPKFEYEYPRPSVTVDCVVIVDAGVPGPQILLIQRAKDPFKGQWALPGGFLDIDETLESAARRELKEETGVKIDQWKYVGVYDTVDRDPRDRVVSNAYLAIIPSKPDVIAADDAAEAQWFNINDLPLTAFDHSKIIADALKLFISQS